jgi:hypothetical protein
MRLPLFRSKRSSLTACLIFAGISASVSNCHSANFGIHFSGDGDAWGGWGPHYLNQMGAHGSGPYESAFGVVAADWFEPGPISQTVQLPGSPTSVNFKPASMGSGSVDIAWESAHPGTGPQDGYTFIPYGFANANRFVMQEDENGDPILDEFGHYVPALSDPNDPNSVIFAEDNGIPVSGDYAVLSGALFATDGVEYAPTWPQGDIVVTITGLGSIASEYTVQLLAAAQNGDVVQGFTAATVSDNASNSETIEFELQPDRPSYWSPFDPDPANPYVSVYGKGESETTFTGDELEIRLTGPNEYFNEDLEFFRTILAAVIIDYEAIVSPGLQGDFNSSGTVDAADYAVWRKTLGDDASYNLWRTNFGATGGGIGSAHAIPEPTAAGLVGLTAILAFTYRFGSRDTLSTRFVRREL